MKIIHFILVGLLACDPGTSTSYPSSSGAMGVGSSGSSGPAVPPAGPMDSGDSDTAEEPNDSGL